VGGWKARGVGEREGEGLMVVGGGREGGRGGWVVRKEGEGTN